MPIWKMSINITMGCLRRSGWGATEGHIRAVEIAADKADLEYIKQEIPKAIRQSLDGFDRISRIVVRAMKNVLSDLGTGMKTNIDLNKAIESTITVAGNEWKYVAEHGDRVHLRMALS